MSVNKKKITDFIQDRRGYFTMVPNDLWEIRGVTVMTKCIWAYIYSRDSRWESSRNNIARNLQISVNTVTTHVQALEQLGMLLVDRTSESWNFEILPPDQWLLTDRKANQPLIQISLDPDQPLTATGSTIDPVANQPLIHTQYNKNNIYTSKAQTGEKVSDYDLLLHVIKSGVEITDFQRKVIDKAMPYLQNGKSLSIKQRDVLKNLLSYDLPIDLSVLKFSPQAIKTKVTQVDISEMCVGLRGKPLDFLSNLEVLDKEQRLYAGSVKDAVRSYAASGELTLVEASEIYETVANRPVSTRVSASLRDIVLGVISEKSKQDSEI